MQNLERVPTLNFERLVVCQEDSDFKVTEENMSQIAVSTQLNTHSLNYCLNHFDLTIVLCSHDSKSSDH